MIVYNKIDAIIGYTKAGRIKKFGNSIVNRKTGRWRDLGFYAPFPILGRRNMGRCLTTQGKGSDGRERTA